MHSQLGVAPGTSAPVSWSSQSPEAWRPDGDGTVLLSRSAVWNASLFDSASSLSDPVTVLRLPPASQVVAGRDRLFRCCRVETASDPLDRRLTGRSGPVSRTGALTARRQTVSSHTHVASWSGGAGTTRRWRPRPKRLRSLPVDAARKRCQFLPLDLRKRASSAPSITMLRCRACVGGAWATAWRGEPSFGSAALADDTGHGGRAAALPRFATSAERRIGTGSSNPPRRSSTLSVPGLALTASAAARSSTPQAVDPAKRSWGPYSGTAAGGGFAGQACGRDRRASKPQLSTVAAAAPIDRQRSRNGEVAALLSVFPRPV